MDQETDVPTATLVDRVRAGDQSAWVALTDRFTGLLWSIARGMRLNHEDAADAVQITWLHLVERIDTLREPGSVGGWLATTMRRECLAALRKRQSQISTNGWEEIPDPADPLDSALLRSEQSSELWSAFRRLKSQCQGLLRVLMADPPPSYAEVALALDMPIGSIGPTRQRCIATLRRLVVSAADPVHIERPAPR